MWLFVGLLCRMFSTRVTVAPWQNSRWPSIAAAWRGWGCLSVNIGPPRATSLHRSSHKLVLLHLLLRYLVPMQAISCQTKTYTWKELEPHWAREASAQLPRANLGKRVRAQGVAPCTWSVPYSSCQDSVDQCEAFPTKSVVGCSLQLKC